MNHISNLETPLDSVNDKSGIIHYDEERGIIVLNFVLFSYQSKDRMGKGFKRILNDLDMGSMANNN